MRNLILFLLFFLSINIGFADHNFPGLSDEERENSTTPFFKSSIIFDPLTDNMGYHNYRIPSLLATQKGTLLAVMEGREDMNFDHAKNDLVLKRSTDGGATWLSPKVIQKAKALGGSN